MTSDHLRYGAHVAANALERAVRKLRRARKTGPHRRLATPMDFFRWAAEPLEIACHDLGCGAFELRHGENVRRFQEMTTDLESAFAYWVTGHKHMTFEMLR